ncbi:MAG: hypothetical protein JO314_12090 [Acidobacteria bacterium]|nr:hypothetical protein [Acidobacteriota bacterium]
MNFTPEWLRDLQYWVRRAKALQPGAVFSNCAEQRILDKYIAEFHIESHSRTAVDIGAGDGIRSSNTFHLFRRGWHGVGIEADSVKYRRLQKTYSSFENVVPCHSTVTVENVISLLRENNIEGDFGVLSKDIDGNDYWVLDAILEHYRPRLIVSEYNEKFPPPIRFLVNYEPEFRLRHHFYGYSIAKLEDLLTKHDYVLLEVEYNNVFLAPRESGAIPKPIEQAYAEGYARRPDRLVKFPNNANMEPLLEMDPKDAVAFIKDFFKKDTGNYTVEL